MCFLGCHGHFMPGTGLAEVIKVIKEIYTSLINHIKTGNAASQVLHHSSQIKNICMPCN